MIEQIVQSNPHAHILFDHDAFSRCTSIGQDPPDGGGNSTGNNANVAALDAQDAVQLITDELWNWKMPLWKWKTPLWWIVEIFPTSYTYQNAQDRWITTFL
jgi:hypothetical protein